MKAITQALAKGLTIAAFLALVERLPNPPRRPLVTCGCGARNDPDARTTCRSCGARL